MAGPGSVEPLGILAHSTTAALACGAAFARRGARAGVHVCPQGPAARPGVWDVLVAVTGARGLPADHGRSRLRTTALTLRSAGWPLGLLHVEPPDAQQLSTYLEELLALGIERAWVAADAETSVHLGPACEPVGLIVRRLLDEGTPAVANQVRFDRARGCHAVVCDAATPTHLRIVARLLRDREIAEPREIVAGPLGLVEELAASLLPDAVPGPQRLAETLPPDAVRRLSAAVSSLSAQLVPPAAPQALLVSSDTAADALPALGSASVEVGGEAAKGIWRTYLIDGVHAGRMVLIQGAETTEAEVAAAVASLRT